MDIKELYSRFVEQENLPRDWKKQLYEALSSFVPEDLKTIGEHRMYVETLQQLRESNAEDMQLNGKKFLSTIASLLAVGEDGVYSSKLRFIYELIQNVDDCEYDDIEDCNLDIRFVYDPAPGKIILTYNERGFKPVNVFTITGIAEESKNISADKTEIGEKGIGFKSVFGVARKVHIESGMFSFELHKDNFTVPIPIYENYEPYQGTRLTIYLDSSHNAKDIHKNLLEQYTKKDAILNKNPILFLNKLTHLKMFFDGWRYIEFNVEKRKKTISSELMYEEEVVVSVDMKSSFNGQDRENNNILTCKRYTLPITYGQEACQSRYGAEIAFSKRRHNLIAVFPDMDESLKNYNGILYSFLPTQIRISAPFVLHVPYKLNGSRDYVDPQGGNVWFNFTNEMLGRFLKQVFIHLASIEKQKVIYYLPKKNSFIFAGDDDNSSRLRIEGLRADVLYNEPIFFCEDGTFDCVKNIVSFAKDDVYEEPVRIHGLLQLEQKLFIPYSADVDMSQYGVSIIDRVTERLFRRGLSNEKVFAEIADVLEHLQQETRYFDIIAKESCIDLTMSQVQVIASHKKIARSFTELSQKYIEYKKRPSVVFTGIWKEASKEFCDTIEELVASADLDQIFEKYIVALKYRFLLLPGVKGDFHLAGNNGVVLSADSALGSFGELSKAFDPRKTFSATLQIRQASERLNAADESMSNAEYLKLLRGVRNSLIGAFGKKSYASYISIINNAGSDKNRFLNEILQNADDCSYPVGVVPEFSLKLDGDILTVAYNECGFTKDNVRAITAIGESTKKLLLNGEDRAIGEKGIGFKSVFGVAEEVEIHSNGFDFKLSDKMPTVPDKCEEIPDTIGTIMKYKLKDKSVMKVFSEDRIIHTCLCLRNIKVITINNVRITIEDIGTKRIINIYDAGTIESLKKTHELERYVYKFDITDQTAIEERSSNQKTVSGHQYLVCYIPPREYKTEKNTLYSGLPVPMVDCNIPLIIDAPFELTTSRDDVLECKWNDYVRNAIYKAVADLMESKKQVLKLDVLRFVGYQNQNGITSFQMFGKKYLNSFDWLNQLKRMAILPCLGEERFVTPGENKRIIPEIISGVVGKSTVGEISGVLIDTRKKSNYHGLLETLGCKRSLINEEIAFMSARLEKYLREEKLRTDFYKYLFDRKAEIEQRNLGSTVRAMKMFPIRTSMGTEYRAYTGNLYTHPSEVSSEDFIILDTSVMSFEICQGLIGNQNRINELTKEVFEARYRNNLEAVIKSNKPKKEIARFLLSEFKKHTENFKKCKSTLVGLLSDIPMEMASGNHRIGNKFVNTKGLILQGEIIQEMYVSEEYKELALFLGCTDILLIHYSDIGLDMDHVSDDDIEDIQSDFKYYADILGGMIEEGLLTDEQIDKFNLQYLAESRNQDDDFDEGFPGKRVADLARLKKHVRDQFANSPNPYVEKQRIVREPMHKVDKEAYTVAMYQSKYNERKCFCQMCQRLVSKNYIERNDVQREPKYGWSQMYLSMCLTCSKDFVLLRNNRAVWERFIQEIKDADVGNCSNVEIAIGDRTIAFTATHLAEIQEILAIKAD